MKIFRYRSHSLPAFHVELPCKIQKRPGEPHHSWSNAKDKVSTPSQLYTLVHFITGLQSDSQITIHSEDEITILQKSFTPEIRYYSITEIRQIVRGDKKRIGVKQIICILLEAQIQDKESIGLEFFSGRSNLVIISIRVSG